MVKSLVFRAGRTSLESQRCFLAVSPWVNYFTYLSLFPHPQNGVKGHTAKAFSSSEDCRAVAVITAPGTDLAAARSCSLPVSKG